MSFRLPPYTNKRQCIICGPTNTTDCLIAVNAAIRLHLFAERNRIVTGGLKICSHHICTNGTIDIIPANKGFVALGKKQRRRSHSNPARVFNPLEPSQQELQEFLHLLQKQHLVSLPTGGDSKESMRNRVQLEDFPDKSDALRSLFKAPSKGHIRALAEEMEAVELASASTSVASSTSKSASSCPHAFSFLYSHLSVFVSTEKRKANGIVFPWSQVYWHRHPFSSAHRPGIALLCCCRITTTSCFDCKAANTEDTTGIGGFRVAKGMAPISTRFWRIEAMDAERQPNEMEGEQAAWCFRLHVRVAANIVECRKRLNESKDLLLWAVHRPALR